MEKEKLTRKEIIGIIIMLLMIALVLFGCSVLYATCFYGHRMF